MYYMNTTLSIRWWYRINQWNLRYMHTFWDLFDFAVNGPQVEEFDFYIRKLCFQAFYAFAYGFWRHG
jgi:hypothetical protein